MPTPLVVRHPGVIRLRAEALPVEFQRQRIDIFPRRAINDPRLSLVPGEHLADLAESALAALDFVNQVRPIERTDEHLRIAQFQRLRNVVPNSLGRRRRVGMQADVRKVGSQ